MADQTRVWIAQCLCPQRHAIMATAGEAENPFAADNALIKPLRAHIEEMLRTGVFNPWCGLCRAPADTWRYEVGRTAFRTLEEAKPELMKNELDQAIVRAAASLGKFP